MTKSLAFRQMRVFLLVWFEQLVSVIGSGLTSFALGVCVYQRTGSVTQFSLILRSAMLPSILISPVAGAFVDRWNRRRCMILFTDIRACGLWKMNCPMQFSVA